LYIDVLQSADLSAVGACSIFALSFFVRTMSKESEKHKDYSNHMISIKLNFECQLYIPNKKNQTF